MAKKELLVNTNPKSMFSEAVKTFTTNLNFVKKKNDKVILFTSPEAGSGKSFTTANTAIAYAQDGKKVLVIDCDLRRGRQHKLFRLYNSSKKGLSNLILNAPKDIESISDYISQTSNKNIDLVTRGVVPPNPVEILNRDEFGKIMTILKKSYDIIILDCPPINGLSDALILSKHSDINIMVVKSKNTNIKLMELAKKNFEKSGSKITGVVINMASPSEYGYSDYYSSEYYYNENDK